MGASFKPLFKYLLIFLLTVVVLASALVGTATIPQERIHEKMLESGVFMYEAPLQYRIFPSVRTSYLDYYADALLLNVAHYMGEGEPLEAVMWSHFNGYHNQYANQYFLEAVRDNPAPNQEYLRYWHGSAGVMRVLHLVLALPEIYVFHAVVLSALLAVLLARLAKHGLAAEAAALVLALVMVAAWVVPWCLEYTWAFLCMLLAAIPAVELARRGREAWLGPLFLVTGMVTVYLDFLTTETLSLLVPLLLVLRIRGRRGAGGQWALSAKCCALWLVGYGGMWAAKWALASVVLGENVMPYVTGHVEERLYGGVGVSKARFMLGAVLRNGKDLMPFDYGIYGAVVLLAVIVLFVLLPVGLGRVRLRARADRGQVLLYLVLGLVPYLRYLVLHNHAWIHAGFTYRAQAATVLALCFLLLELIEPVPNKKGGLRFGKSS